MNEKTIQEQLFILKDMNIYKHLNNALFTSLVKQNIYRYKERENIPLNDFILICNYLSIPIILDINGSKYQLSIEGLKRI